MSYQLEQERTGKVPKIEMPPLPEEQIKEVAQPQQQVKQKQDQPKYDIHPDLASEFIQPIQEQAEVEEPVKEEIQVSPEQSKPQVNELDPRSLRGIIKEKAERAERAERERDELLRRLQESESNRYKAAPQVEKEEEPDLEDEYVEAKYLKRYDKKIRELEDKLKNTEQTTNLQSIDARLKAKYPDMDNIVSQENLELLKSVYPEIAESIKATPDLYNKAVTAYTVIKKLGIAMEDNFVEDKQKAQKNAIKPRPMASISPQQGDSPLSKANAFANGLTDDLKTQLRREMEEARRNM